MKLIFPCFIILVCISCNTNNLLNLKWHKNYHETSEMERDTNGAVMLTQSVCHQKPRVIDAGGCYTISFLFNDTIKALEMNKIDLKRDTGIVSSSFGFISVWHWEDESNPVEGTIKVLKWKDNKIRLQENINVEEKRRQAKMKFSGKRTFKVRK